MCSQFFLTNLNVGKYFPSTLSFGIYASAFENSLSKNRRRIFCSISSSFSKNLWEGRGAVSSGRGVVLFGHPRVSSMSHVMPNPRKNKSQKDDGKVTVLAEKSAFPPQPKFIISQKLDTVITLGGGCYRDPNTTDARLHTFPQKLTNRERKNLMFVSPIGRKRKLKVKKLLLASVCESWQMTGRFLFKRCDVFYLKIVGF